MTTRKYLTFGEGASRIEGGLRPIVRAIGVGGAGCNIVDAMAGLGLGHIEPVAVNTDAQNLHGLRCRTYARLRPYRCLLRPPRRVRKPACDGA